jgi:hypothetical protein
MERILAHLMSSINAAAAAAIQPSSPESSLPAVGSAVVYTMRTGHGRNGRTRFPALVQAHRFDHMNGHSLDLTVVIDAGDLSDETFVREAAPGTDNHCWERPDAAPQAAPVGASNELAELRAEIAMLRKIILGDYDDPKASVLDILVDFEGRLSKKTTAIKPKRK